MKNDSAKTIHKLMEIMSPQNGYCGRVSNWSQEIKPHSNIGYDEAVGTIRPVLHVAEHPSE